MASYLDNIPSFNDYVEQRPQDEMLKVGMFKQQRYEQGVQRIQKSIDNIAGLDVVRPQDKQYLQSKLNALGGQLSSVAGGDFSNFQLVNTVDGMTNQLVKDPNILNAVGSAAKYRKQLENQEKINLEGKGSESNDWDFNRRVQSWYEGGQDASFNTQFKPYVDYNEAAMKIVKALASDSIENDVYMGKDKNGRTVIYDAVTKTKVAGITADKIQTALSAGLTPDAFRQMGIDGEFQYSSQDDEMFSQNVNESYSSTFDELLKERDSLEVRMNVASTAEKKLEIQSQIDALDAQTNLLKQEYDNVSSTFTSGDVDSAKARLYSTNWMRDFSNSMSSQNVSQTIQSNPLKTVQLKQQQMQQAAAQFEAKYKQTERYNKSRIDIEQAKLDMLKDPYGGISQSNPQELNNDQIIARAEVNKENNQKLVSSLEKNMLTKYNWTPENLADQLLLLESTPREVRTDARQELIQYQKLLTKQISDQTVYEIIQQEANILTDEKNISFSIGDGLTSDYNTASGLFNKFDAEYRDIGPAGITYGSYRITDENRNRARAELTESDYKMFEFWAAAFDDNDNFFQYSDEFDEIYGDGSRNSGNFEEKLFSDIRQFGREIVPERNKFIADELKKTTLVPQAVSYQVPLTNTAEKASFTSMLLGIANDRQTLDEDLADGIRMIANDITGANVITQSQEGGNYKLTIMGDMGLGKSPSTETIELSEAQYQEIFKGRYDKSPEVQYFDDNYLGSMLNTRMPLIKDDSVEGGWRRDPQTFWTTATDMKYNSTHENAGLKGQTDFPATQYYGVSGNLISSSNPKSLETTYRLILNIYDPVTDKLIEGFMPEMIIRKEQVAPTLQTITDEVIYQMLNGPNAQFTDEIYNQLVKAAEGNLNRTN